MAGSASFPTSEAELVQNRPASNEYGVFPRKWFLRDERLLWESRPSLWSLYWGRILLFEGFGLLLLVDATFPQYQTNAGYWGFEIFLLVVPLSLIILSWRGYAYALTSRRLLKVSGLFSSTLEYANYDEVQGLTVSSGTNGDLKFELGSPGGAALYQRAAARPKRLKWNCVLGSASVYDFIQAAFRIHSIGAARTAELQSLVGQTMQNRVVCEYCGGLIDLAAIDRSSPKCLQCGAPFRLDQLSS